MDFDFDNPEKYIKHEPTEQALASVKKMQEVIGETVLSEWDNLFITDIKHKILNGKKMTAGQTKTLSRILTGCKLKNYIPYVPRKNNINPLDYRRVLQD